MLQMTLTGVEVATEETEEVSKVGEKGFFCFPGTYRVYQ